MGQTPDRFPGRREDECLLLDSGSIHPTETGEIRYVQNLGFRFLEEGVEKGLTGSGLSEADHEALSTLVHEIDATSFDEVLYSGSNNPASYIVWTDSSKTQKIREELYTYSSSRVTQVVTKQYDLTGSLKMTMTENYTYSGNKVSTVTRTKS